MSLEAINTILLTGVTAAAGATMPWVISVERRLAKLCNGGLAGRVDKLEDGLQEAEVRCAGNHPQRHLV